MNLRPNLLPRVARVGDVYASFGRPPTSVDYWVVLGVTKGGKEVCLAGYDRLASLVMVARQPFNPKRPVIGQAQFSIEVVFHDADPQEKSS